METKQDSTENIFLVKEVKYQKIKQLVLASYLLGQESGLNGFAYNHMESVMHRDRLVELILAEI